MEQSQRSPRLLPLAPDLAVVVFCQLWGINSLRSLNYWTCWHNSWFVHGSRNFPHTVRQPLSSSSLYANHKARLKELLSMSNHTENRQTLQNDTPSWKRNITKESKPCYNLNCSAISTNIQRINRYLSSVSQILESYTCKCYYNTF